MVLCWVVGSCCAFGPTPTRPNMVTLRAALIPKLQELAEVSALVGVVGWWEVCSSPTLGGAHSGCGVGGGCGSGAGGGMGHNGCLMRVCVRVS
jgi:hypothetical protein